MMTGNTIVKEQINIYYDKMLDLACSITKDYESGTELLHIVLFDILSTHKKSVHDAIKNNLFSYYVYMSMHYQFVTRNSQFRKMLINRDENVDISSFDFESLSSTYDDKIDKDVENIMRFVDENMDWYSAQVYKLYYFYNYEMIKLKKSDETINTSQITYRKLAKKLNINHVSLNKTVKKVNNKIKEEFKLWKEKQEKQ